MSQSRPLRVLLCVTHPGNCNGYSRVGHHLAKELSKYPDTQLSIYGFQNFHKIENHRKDFPKNVQVYDAFANENPKGAGFGFGEVKEYVRINKPDVIVIYNDLLVVTTILQQLSAAIKEGSKFKIICYIDQVYLNQRKDYINLVNNVGDVAMLFTKYWEENIIPQGIKLPTCYLPHGFDPMAHFPVSKTLARRFYNLRSDDFIVINLNRNQPRKRWDICIQAFSEVLKTHADKPIKLLIATAVQGAWNIIEVFERELGKRGLTLEQGMKHVIMLDNPQQMSDEDINILQNVADIGINTCDGEGFGLCQFEGACCDVPQIVPKLGGFLDFFDDSCALMMEPKMTYYVDSSRDMVCGEAQLCDYRDFAKAIIRYYENPELRKEHARVARERILSNYRWEDIGKKLHDICMATHRGENVRDVKQNYLRRKLMVVEEEDEEDDKKPELIDPPAVVSAGIDVVALKKPHLKAKTKKLKTKSVGKTKVKGHLTELKKQLDDMLLNDLS
jgi:glycosyltransferase involved in cell wall biosynthesis